MTLSPQCKSYMSQFSDGRFEPPYGLPRRDLRISSSLKRNLGSASVDLYQTTSQVLINLFHKSNATRNSSPIDEQAPKQLVSGKWQMAFVTTMVIAVGAYVVMSRMRNKSRVDVPFTSAARSDLRDIQVTRYFDDAPQQVTTGQGYRVLTHNPEEQHYLGKVRKRLRSSQHKIGDNDTDSAAWASHNSSADTLVTQGSQPTSTPSKVSLRHMRDNDNEEHDGAIELPAQGKTRNFFDHKTGEFIHLAPWKSAHDEEKESGGKVKERRKAKPALAQMAIGAGALAGGKSADDLFLEELQDTVIPKMPQKEKISPRAGDCFAGLVTNEAPTGKPNML